MAVQLSGLEKDKAAADEVLEDLSALAAAALTQPGLCPLHGAKAAAAIRAADETRRRLHDNGSVKLVLTLCAASLAQL